MCHFILFKISRIKKVVFHAKFKIPMDLKHPEELTNDRQYRPWLPSPPKLLEYTGDLVNKTPMPLCWEWTIEEVINWLRRTVGLAQYQDCLRRNFINGRRLLLLDIFGFEKIGICDFFHRKRISAAVRKLIGVEKPRNDRSISLPPRYPWTHYLMYRVPTGPSREAMTPYRLFQKMGFLNESDPCPFGHWEMIEPTWNSFPCNRFGSIARKNVYNRVEHARQPRGHSYLQKSKTKLNYFVPSIK